MSKSLLVPEARTPEELRRLADIHIARYRGMLATARIRPTGFRVDELLHYQRIWEGIEAKGYQWGKLTDDEKSEIYDAVMSGE